VVDSEGEFARDLRLRLLREHLDRAADGSEDGGLVDPAAAVGEIVAAQGHWTRGTNQDVRERDRRAGCGTQAERVHPLSRLWAEPAYRFSMTRTAGRIAIGSSVGCEFNRLASASIGHPMSCQSWPIGSSRTRNALIPHPGCLRGARAI